MHDSQALQKVVQNEKEGSGWVVWKWKVDRWASQANVEPPVANIVRLEMQSVHCMHPT